MTTVDRTAASDAEFRQRIAPFEAQDNQQRAADLVADVHSGWCSAWPGHRAGGTTHPCHCRLQGVQGAIAAALDAAEARGRAEVAAKAAALADKLDHWALTNHRLMSAPELPPEEITYHDGLREAQHLAAARVRALLAPSSPVEAGDAR